MARRSLVAALSGAALVVSGLLVPLGALPAHAAQRTVTLVGTMQSELGCGKDWDETCTSTDLAPVEGTTTYAKTVTVPAGTYAYKVDSVPRIAVNGKYYTSAEKAGDLNQVFVIVDQLIGMSRKGKPS